MQIYLNRSVKTKEKKCNTIDANDKKWYQLRSKKAMTIKSKYSNYQVRMVIMMINSALNPSDIDKPTEQVSSFLSSGDLANTSTLWLTGKIWDLNNQSFN